MAHNETCNHDHDHGHDHGHSHDNGHDKHDHGHDHATEDPGEVIAEKSPQDQLLIGICAVAMILLMSFMGVWMQIQTPSGGGHEEHGSGEAHSSLEPTLLPAENHAPAPHETQSH